MSERNATLIVEDATYTLPIIEGSEKEKAIDVRSLLKDSGHITLDSGFMNTGACQSNITFLDGKKGILNYRGYPIEELAERCSFVEVAYLLLHGELPNRQELNEFRALLARYALLHEDMIHFFDHFPPNASPMSAKVPGRSSNLTVKSLVMILLPWITYDLNHYRNYFTSFHICNHFFTDYLLSILIR